ncbi:kbp-like protein [Cystoisospora suis]|uniref:KIF-binding protein n=1 Tax=Cystoisospora suis TaxID=483139 RepID=A0A2C6LCE3_9APIC|nr:kbp-like protein [Cystoisospora suis]
MEDLSSPPPLSVPTSSFSPPSSASTDLLNEEEEERQKAKETLRLLKSLLCGDRSSDQVPSSSSSLNSEKETVFSLCQTVSFTAAKYRTILKREQEGSPVDPDEEEALRAALNAVQAVTTGGTGDSVEPPTPEILAPFRPKYAGRRLLQKTAQDVYQVLRSQQSQKDGHQGDHKQGEGEESAAQSSLFYGYNTTDASLLVLAHLYCLLGENYINTEETTEGERRLRKCVEILMKVASPPSPLASSSSAFGSSISLLDVNQYNNAYTGIWSFLLFSRPCLLLRGAIALLDLVSLYARWQRAKDALLCFSRVSVLLALAKLELQHMTRDTRGVVQEDMEDRGGEEESVASPCSDLSNARSSSSCVFTGELAKKREFQGSTEGEDKRQVSFSSCPSSSPHENRFCSLLSETARILLLVVESLELLRRCVSARLRLLESEGEEDEREQGQTSGEAAAESCGAIAELLEKRSRVLTMKEKGSEKTLAQDNGKVNKEDKELGEENKRRTAGKQEQLSGTAAEGSSSSHMKRGDGDATKCCPPFGFDACLPGVIFSFFSFSPFVVDIKDIVRNLLSISTYYGYTAKPGMKMRDRKTEGRAEEDGGYRFLFTAEYVLHTAECLLEEEKVRKTVLSKAREERRRRKQERKRLPREVADEARPDGETTKNSEMGAQNTPENKTKEAAAAGQCTAPGSQQKEIKEDVENECEREKGGEKPKDFDAASVQQVGEREAGNTGKSQKEKEEEEVLTDSEGEEEAGEEELVIREGEEIIVKVVTPDVHELDELIAEVKRDKSLLYAHRLEASRKILSNPHGTIKLMADVQEEEDSDRATGTEGQANKGEEEKERESSNSPLGGVSEDHGEEDEGKCFEDVIIRKHAPDFPPMLLDVQDCLALLCVSESCIRTTWMEQLERGDSMQQTKSSSSSSSSNAPASQEQEEKAGEGESCRASPGEVVEKKKEVEKGALEKDQSGEKEGDSHGDAVHLREDKAEASQSGQTYDTLVGDSPSCDISGATGGGKGRGVHTTQNSLLDFTSRPVKRDSVWYTGSKAMDTRKEGKDRAKERFSDGENEMTVWDNPPGTENNTTKLLSEKLKEQMRERLIRLTENLQVRCAVFFPSFHLQVGTKLKKANLAFLRVMSRLEDLHASLLPYKNFISRHLMALALVDDFAAPRCLFQMSLHESQAALQTFQLDGWTTEHTRLIIHQAALYKEISFFEDDLKRYIAMHTRRANLLSSLVDELNPQHYLDLVRQMQFELGETYKELYRLKWTGDIQKNFDVSEDAPELDPLVVQNEEIIRMWKSPKLHGIAAKSVLFFTAFLDSFRKPPSAELPHSRSQSDNFTKDKISDQAEKKAGGEKNEDVDVPEELRAVYLAARIARAKMLTRMGTTKDEMIQFMVKALKEYEWMHGFLAELAKEEGPSSSFASPLRCHLELCEQTLQLLPLRISKLAALGR